MTARCICSLAILLLAGHAANAQDAVRLPPVRVSDGVEVPPEKLKQFREGLAVAIRFCSVDPDLADIIKKRNFVFDVVPDAVEQFLAPLDLSPNLKKAIKSKDFDLRSYAEPAANAKGSTPRFSIILDQSLVTAQAMENVANMNLQLFAIKMLSEGESPEKIASWHVKIYQASIASLQLIYKNRSDRPDRKPAVLAVLKQQIGAQRRYLASWERLAAVTGN